MCKIVRDAIVGLKFHLISNCFPFDVDIESVKQVWLYFLRLNKLLDV
jgi:hypothetical protein